jgi:serine/threonine protein kinase
MRPYREDFTMSGSASDADPLGPLADEFLQRHRRGEQPALTEYTARYPELADQIRELFPALLLMEDVRPGPQAAAEPPPPESSPRSLGEYRLVREIGRGGMGVVYEAEQESLGRRVALKVLPPGVQADPRQIQRFQREARAAARLHHTNIVPVFAVGEENGTYYYVMQYIEGCSLGAVLAELRQARRKEAAPAAPPEPGVRSSDHNRLSAGVARSLSEGRFRAPAEANHPEPGSPSQPTEHDFPDGPPSRLPSEAVGQAAEVSPLPQTDTQTSRGTSSGSSLTDPHRPYAQSVAHIGVQVAEALEYAAGQGVLHRDVKPSNLLLDVWGTVWLTDFGLAKATGTPDLTGTGDLLGTLRYMAPERFHGRADVRSDVYSLGLTLYEMLALRPPFDASGQGELMRQITATEPPRLDRLVPGLPHDLVTVAHKAMAKDPADRYQTPATLADDLRRFLDDRPILARRLGLPERAWRWCRRNPALAGALIGVAAALVVGTVVSLAYRLEAASARTAAATARAEQAEEAERSAREALEKVEDTLAENLMRPVGYAEGVLSLAELGAFRDLARSPSERVRVRFIDKALEGPETAVRLGRRAEVAAHAAVGLDRKRRDRVALILLHKWQDEHTPPEVRAACVQLGLALEVRDEAFCREALQAAAGALAQTPDANDRAALARATGILADRASPEQAAAALPKVLDALATTTAPHVLPALADAVGRLANRLPAEEGVKAAADAAHRLFEAVVRTPLALSLPEVARGGVESRVLGLEGSSSWMMRIISASAAFFSRLASMGRSPVSSS